MFAVVLLMVAACVTSPADQLPADYVLWSRGETGIIVGSVTSPGDPDFGPGHDYARSIHTYRSVSDEGFVGALTSAHERIVPFAEPDPRLEAGLEAVNGRLFVVELPPGEYEFMLAEPAPADSVNTGGYERWEVPLTGHRFTVLPRTVTYIGDLESRVCRGWVYARFCSVSSCDGIQAVSGRIFDRFDRDWPLLAERFPFLQEASVQRSVITAEPWFRRRLQETGWQPPHDASWSTCAYPPDSAQ